MHLSTILGHPLTGPCNLDADKRVFTIPGRFRACLFQTGSKSTRKFEAASRHANNTKHVCSHCGSRRKVSQEACFCFRAPHTWHRMGDFPCPIRFRLDSIPIRFRFDSISMLFDPMPIPTRFDLLPIPIPIPSQVDSIPIRFDSDSIRFRFDSIRFRSRSDSDSDSIPFRFDSIPIRFHADSIRFASILFPIRFQFR